jgi:hypothetical protein
MRNPFRRKPAEQLPDPTSAANEQAFFDMQRARDKEQLASQALITRLQQQIAANSDATARLSNEPEPMISLSVALALVAVDHEWARRRLESGEIEGEKRDGRWYVRLSSLIRAKNAAFGL